jgi:hypothetical protein
MGLKIDGMTKRETKKMIKTNKTDFNRDIFASVWNDNSCRIFHCYREHGDLFCKRMYDANSTMYAPYQEVVCVSNKIPLWMDPMVLRYKSIPKEVHIE